MSRPPRNRELERLVIDVLRATPATAESAERHAAWQVYADWLLGFGEPVGEWLAASLRADDLGEAAAPVRAQLGEIERATRFRLVDLELADLSEVPELTRIADFVWERGFITRAALRCRAFREWDSALLGHTPDRLLDVVLRSPSASMLHCLELDAYEFEAEGVRHLDIAHLLTELDEPLPLRELELGTAAQLEPEMFEATPELQQLRVRAPEVASESAMSSWRQREYHHFGIPVPKREAMAARAARLDRRRSPGQLIEALSHEHEPTLLPRLEQLEIMVPGAGDGAAEALCRSPALARLTHLRLGYVGEDGAGAIWDARERFAHLQRLELARARVPKALARALTDAGCVISQAAHSRA